MKRPTSQIPSETSVPDNSAIRNPKSEFEWEADELLAITVASINTAKKRSRKK